MSNLTTQVTTVVSDAKVAVKSLQHLIEATALLAVSIYGEFNALHSHMTTLGHATVVVSGGVIGLRGGYEFLRHLAKKV